MTNQKYQKIILLFFITYVAYAFMTVSVFNSETTILGPVSRIVVVYIWCNIAYIGYMQRSSDWCWDSFWHGVLFPGFFMVLFFLLARNNNSFILLSGSVIAFIAGLFSAMSQSKSTSFFVGAFVTIFQLMVDYGLGSLGLYGPWHFHI